MAFTVDSYGHVQTHLIFSAGLKVTDSRQGIFLLDESGGEQHSITQAASDEPERLATTVGDMMSDGQRPGRWRQEVSTRATIEVFTLFGPKRFLNDRGGVLKGPLRS